MKWLFLLLILMLVVGFVRNNPTLLPGSRTLSSPAPTPVVQGIEITYQNIRYIVYTQLVDPLKLSLIPNFTERKTTQRIVSENNCKYGTNAGFYTPEQKPLGFFSTDSATHAVTPAISSSLLSGFVVKTNTTVALVNQLPTQSAIQFGFQSGPLFTPTQVLRIIDDEPDRRVLLGKTSDNEIYFIAIVAADNAHSGPLLADLPQIFQAFNDLGTQQITQLINLDGGSASTFYGEQVTLQELVPVGSFLCEVE